MMTLKLLCIDKKKKIIIFHPSPDRREKYPLKNRIAQIQLIK